MSVEKHTMSLRGVENICKYMNLLKNIFIPLLERMESKPEFSDLEQSYAIQESHLVP